MFKAFRRSSLECTTEDDARLGIKNVSRRQNKRSYSHMLHPQVPVPFTSW